MIKMINVTKADVPEIEEYIKYLRLIWKDRWLTNDGPLVQLLENNLIKFLNIKNLIPVANGTLAIQIALKSLQVKGEVITTPFTFSATTNTILWEGLKPVFADINKETFNIDPADVERKITNETTSILAVHIYGNPCQLNDLQEIADEYSLNLIYDAAHAFGVEYNNKSILEFGEISTLSFHATKMFNTIEGGALSTSNQDIVEKIRLMSNHGIKSEEEVILPGTNAKMNEFQAAMGLCNLENLNQNIEKRKTIYELYLKHLKKEDGLNFQKVAASKFNYGYMPVLFENLQIRNEVYDKLLKKGIHTRKYFYPLTTNCEYFKQENIDLNEKYNLKIAPNIADRVLCLPIYPDLELDTVNKIIDEIITII